MKYCNYRDVTSVYSLNSQKLPGHFSYAWPGNEARCSRVHVEGERMLGHFRQVFLGVIGMLTTRIRLQILMIAFIFRIVTWSVLIKQEWQQICKLHVFDSQKWTAQMTHNRFLLITDIVEQVYWYCNCVSSSWPLSWHHIFKFLCATETYL